MSRTFKKKVVYEGDKRLFVEGPEDYSRNPFLSKRAKKKEVDTIEEWEKEREDDQSET